MTDRRFFLSEENQYLCAAVERTNAADFVTQDFEDYSNVSATYDDTRVPVCVEIILGALVTNSIPLFKQTILDAGCGTGNYIERLMGGLGRIYGIDRSEAMLAVARRKIGCRAELAHGCLLNLPYGESFFDGVICNQVLHHLDAGTCEGEEDSESFPNVCRFLREVSRVLKPGGVLVINTCSHRQVLEGYWWADLIPKASLEIQRRYPDMSLLNSFLEEAGFKVESVYIDVFGSLQGEAYRDVYGPRRETWRKGDSTWSVSSREEVSAAIQQVNQMEQEGRLKAYFDKREEVRRVVGQTTSLCARVAS